MNNKRQLRFPSGEVLAGVETVLSYDQKTMKGSAKFIINNQECPQILLSSHQAKIFSNFSLIKKDLKFCKTALSIASRLVNDDEELKQAGGFRPEFDEQSDVLKGMYISFVVTYGKCFTKADGRRVKLEVQDTFDNAELKKLHLEVMHQRHEYIAHGGNTKFEQVDPIVVLYPDKYMNVAPLLTTQSYHLVGFNKSKFERYLELVNFVDKKLNVLLEKKAAAIYEKEITPKKLDELYKDAQT